MNIITIVFTLVTSILIAALPRREAMIPLLLGASYIGPGASLDLGPASFTVLRILVAIGVLRVLIKGEQLAHGMNKIDKMLIVSAVWLIATSFFHTSDAWVYRSGIVWSEIGSYFLFRVFVRDYNDVEYIFKIVCIILVPIAISMVFEKVIGRNIFDIFGGYSGVVIQEGHVRARGTFAHPILAGTVGATCFPMALFLWKRHRKHALIGLFAATGIILTSTSSGPIMMVLIILFAISLWMFRKRIREIFWLTVAGLIALDIYMKDPIYFLMAKIDLTGRSTGWHRAELIRSSIEHLNEWWLVGTDYTRHWMPTGIHANEIHTDITNHFLGIGVMGGLPLIMIFIVVLVSAFVSIYRALYLNAGAKKEHLFLIWMLGAILFGHVVNFFSISLFDQSITFFYLILACIGTINSRNWEMLQQTLLTLCKVENLMQNIEEENP